MCRTFTQFLFLTALAFALVLSRQLAAQQSRYKLIDLGTFGGPTSVIAPTDFGAAENPGRGLAYPNMGAAGQHEHFGVLFMPIEFIARGGPGRT